MVRPDFERGARWLIQLHTEALIPGRDREPHNLAATRVAAIAILNNRGDSGSANLPGRRAVPVSHPSRSNCRTQEVNLSPRFPALLPAALAISMLAPAVRAADTTSAADQAFVAMVSQGGLFEVKAGQLAAERGHTQDIQDQGWTEAHDHQLVGDKLKSIAAAAGIQVADSLNAQFQKELADLQALSGKDFDAAYLRDMDDIHKKDGAAFATEAKAGSNPALRAFAAETHRIVLRHLGELHALGPDNER